MSAIQQMLIGAGGGATDPYYTSVSLLLHMDGSNGSTTFTDNSPNTKIVTANGGAQISTSVVKYGTGGAAITSSYPCYLSVPASADFNFGSGPFTVEFWVYPLGGGVPITLGDGALSINIDGGSYPGVVYVAKQNVIALGSSYGAGAVTFNQWNHVAIVQNATNVFIFINGVNSIGGAGSIAAQSWANSSGILIGETINYTYQLNGYLDDLRITKGVARYTSNFTPPTGPFPNS